MSINVLHNKISSDFDSVSEPVIAEYHAWSIQNMGKAELQHVKALLGHGEDWTTWTTPRAWFPGGSDATWNVRMEERIKARLPRNLTNDDKLASLLQILVEQMILSCNRFLVLCRIGPMQIKNGRDSLDPSAIAQIAYAYLPYIAAISIEKAILMNVGMDELSSEGEKSPQFPACFASVSKEDVTALQVAESTKHSILKEMKRMHAASTQDYWSDVPLIWSNLKNPTRVSGELDTHPPENIRSPHLPLPDEFVADIGKKSHWIIENLGPNILRVLSSFQNIWQDVHDSNFSVRLLSSRCKKLLKDHTWTDASGQSIDKLPFKIQLDQTGGHSKNHTKIKMQDLSTADRNHPTLSNIDPKAEVEVWPPRTAAEFFGLAKALQGAHLFVTGLSTGSRNGEILSMKRNAVRRSPDGTAFANGRTFKLVRRHEGELRDWALPEFAERAFEQQARLVYLVERLSPLNTTYPVSSPRDVAEGDNLWFGVGVRSSHVNSQTLTAQFKRYAEVLGLESNPGGQPIRPHRLRKTLARLVALAIAQAPKILQDVFGHKNIDMTMHYILTDEALSAEIDEIVRELRIIRCTDDLSKFASSDSGPLSSEVAGPANSRSSSDTPSDGFGGRAAPSIRRAIAEQELVLHRRAQDWGAEDIRDLAEVLTLGGTTWNLVRPGVLCTKSLNQFGPCNKKRGHPDPAGCQTSCDHRLEQAWLRQDVDGCIAEALAKWELEIANQNDLVAEFWAGQVRTHIGRFADLEKKWSLDLRVQQICGPAMLSEA